MEFTSTIENSINKIKSNLTKAQLVAFVSCVVAGFIAHGFVFFNRISYHDNSASLFDLGATYESGRWFLGILYKLQLLTTKSFSLPLFNGLLSIIFIAISAILIVKIFETKSVVAAGFVGAMMAVFPVVTSIFSFMFTSWPYFLAMLLAVISAKTVIERRSVKTVIVSIIFLACSMGIYQAFFAVTISLLLIALFMKVISFEISTVSDYAKAGGSYLISLAGGLVLWAILRKVFMAAKHIEAVAYKGMDEAYSLSKLPVRFAVAFKAFFGFEFEGLNALRYLRCATALIFVVAVVQILVLLIRNSAKLSVKLASLVGLVLLPVGMEVVYFLSTSSEYQVDTLMLYGDIFVVLFPVVLIQYLEEMTFGENLGTKLLKLGTWVQIICMTIVGVGYIYLDNAAYMKASITQEESIAYFTELTTRIKSCEGFADDMEIILVGWDYLEDETMVDISPQEQLSGIKLEKYPTFKELVSYPGSINFIREHLAFGNDKVIKDDDGEYAKMPEIKAMPSYPDDGCIKVIDGKVFVKMGQE